MTSKIVVNNIEADAGVSTVTFGSEISASTFTGNVTGNVTGNLTGTASTATAAATAYGISGTPTLSGITSVSTSNLTVNGTAYPNAGPLSNRNLIINGAMQVAQRGTSSTTSNYGTVDRFPCYFTGGAQTQTQETLTSGDPYNEGFRYFLRIANTTAYTGADGTRQIMAKLEAQNVAQSGWNYASSTSYVTVSFWVRASVSQEYYGYFHTRDGTLQIYPFSLGTLSANTWTKVTKTVPGNSNITIDNNNGEGMRLVLSPFWGTDYTDSGVSLDTWAAYSSSARTPDYTNTWAGTTNATFDVTGVQLEVGSVATPFEHRSFGDELARCQRYYFNAADITGSGDVSWPSLLVSAGGIYVSNCRFPVPMRTPPSVVSTGMTGTGTCFLNWPGTGSSTLSNVSQRHSSTNTGTIQGGQDSSFGGAGFHVNLEISDTFTGTYGWSAEL